MIIRKKKHTNDLFFIIYLGREKEPFWTVPQRKLIQCWLLRWTLKNDCKKEEFKLVVRRKELKFKEESHEFSNNVPAAAILDGPATASSVTASLGSYSLW